MKRVPLSSPRNTQTFESFVHRLQKSQPRQAQAVYLQNQDLFVHRPDMLTRLVAQLPWETGLAVLSKAYFVHRVELGAYRVVASQMNHGKVSGGAHVGTPACCWRSATRLLGTALEEHGSSTPWQMYTSVAQVCARSRRWECGLHLLRVAEARNATSAPLVAHAARCCATPSQWALAARLLHIAATSETYALPFARHEQLSHGAGGDASRAEAEEELELAVKRRIEGGANDAAAAAQPLFALEPALRDVLAAAAAPGAAAIKQQLGDAIGNPHVVGLLEIAGALPARQELLLEALAGKLGDDDNKEVTGSWRVALEYIASSAPTPQLVALQRGRSSDNASTRLVLSEEEQEWLTCALCACFARFGERMPFGDACAVLDALLRPLLASDSSLSAAALLRQAASQHCLSRMHVERLAWHLLHKVTSGGAAASRRRSFSRVWLEALELAALHGCRVTAESAGDGADLSFATSRVFSRLLEGLYGVALARTSASGARAISEAAVNTIVAPMAESLSAAGTKGAGETWMERAAHARYRHTRAQHRLAALKASKQTGANSLHGSGLLLLPSQGFSQSKPDAVRSGPFAMSPQALHAAAVFAAECCSSSPPQQGEAEQRQVHLRWDTALSFVQSLATPPHDDSVSPLANLHHRTCFVLLQRCVAASAPEKAMQLLNKMQEVSATAGRHSTAAALDGEALRALEALLFCTIYHRPREARVLFDGVVARCSSSDNNDSRSTEALVSLSGVYWDAMSQMGYRDDAKASLAAYAPAIFSREERQK